jgi:hypothetical protein
VDALVRSQRCEIEVNDRLVARMCRIEREVDPRDDLFVGARGPERLPAGDHAAGGHCDAGDFGEGRRGTDERQQ